MPIGGKSSINPLDLHHSSLPAVVLVAGWGMKPLIGLLVIATCSAWAGLEEKVFEKEITTSLKIPYLLDLPPGFEDTGEKKWPLLIFLHGAGERGSDINKVKVHGPPKLSGKMKELESFVVASPQCPAEEWWDPRVLKPFVDDVIERYSIDETRVYLTGLSMGGYGTWSFATRYPETFAAVAPICGGGTPYLSARRMEDLPVWVFHGAKDPVVKLEESNLMVDAFRAMERDIKLTVYPEAGHDSWTETYANPEFYRWLLSHKRTKQKE